MSDEDLDVWRPAAPRPGAQPLVVSDVQPEYGDGVQASSAWFEGGHLAEGVRLRFRLHGEGPLDHSGTPFVPLASVLGAWAGVDVVVDAPVDLAAVAGARRAIAVQSDFWGWRVPEIDAPAAVDAGPATQAAGAPGTRPGDPGDGRGVGLFFTRGVDSTSALLTGGGAVTHLLGIDWVDPPLAGDATAAVWAGTSGAAAERGLPLLRLSTDLRGVTEPLPGWNHTHVPAMAGFALLLAPQVGEVWIAASEGSSTTQRWPSHEASDPLWSSSSVAIVHRYPVAGGRYDRTAVLAGDDWAMRWLKVCYQRPGDGNCGRCAKCLTTMAALELLGRGDAIEGSFDAPLTPEAVWAAAADPPIGIYMDRREILDRLPEGELRTAWAALVAAITAKRTAAGLPT